MSTKTNEISIDNAKAWTAAWREQNAANCKAFLIPVKDLVAVLKEMNVLSQSGDTYVLNESQVENAGVRNYMAIDKNESDGNGEKILVVGTNLIDGVHKDIINIQDDELSGGGSGIYDFSKPCPSLCDKDSILN